MIELTEGLNEVTVSLAPSGVSPLPEGFYVDTIIAEPPVVILGNEVKINVGYQVPDGVDVRPYIGKTYQARCTIDGETLTISVGPIPYFPVDAHFVYVPQSVGTYTATVLDKSVSFKVEEEVVGVFYNPFGGYTAYGSLSALAEIMGANEDAYSEQFPSRNGWIIIEIQWAGRLYTEGIVCPYCSKVFAAEPNALQRGAAPGALQAAAFELLLHIQDSHPDHPLTIPRAHIEVTVPQLPSVWSRIYPQAYYIVIDGMCGEIGYTLQPGSSSYWTFNNVGLFAAPLGNHHVEVGGPLLGGCWMYSHILRRGGTLPTFFSKDVTLQALGDKVTIDAETGLMGYIEW